VMPRFRKSGSNKQFQALLIPIQIVYKQLTVKELLRDACKNLSHLLKLSPSSVWCFY